MFHVLHLPARLNGQGGCRLTFLLILSPMDAAISAWRMAHYSLSFPYINIMNIMPSAKAWSTDSLPASTSVNTGAPVSTTASPSTEPSMWMSTWILPSDCE